MNTDHQPHHAMAVLGVGGPRGEPALCVAIETTFTVRDGRCLALEVQPPVELEGRWSGKPGASTPIDPPTSPVPKVGTDVILRGHALAPTELVEVRVGPLVQRLRVCGDRTWQRRWYGILPSEPAAWESIPLLWESAANGERNPLGRGCPPKFRDGVALPNLEHPTQPLRRWGRKPVPVGTMWTLPAFAHRRTNDVFDPRAANAAAPELIADTGLHGDEAVLVVGATVTGHWYFLLPGIPPPRVTIAAKRGDLAPVALLDTVLIDADAGTVRLTWRAWTTVADHALVGTVEVR